MASCTTRNHRYAAVILGWEPARVATLVTGCAVRRRGDVICIFSTCCCAIVASGTKGCGSEGAVIHLGTDPGGGGFVATLATGCS